MFELTCTACGKVFGYSSKEIPDGTTLYCSEDQVIDSDDDEDEDEVEEEEEEEEA